MKLKHGISTALEDFELIAGAGSEDSKQACAMTLLAWCAGREWSDAPPCAHPLLRGEAIAVNDDSDTTEKMRAKLVRAGRDGILDTWWIPSRIIVWAFSYERGEKPGEDRFERLLRALARVAEWKTRSDRGLPSDFNLTGAYLTGAYLTGAYLTGADLTGANLTRADLTGANLTRANLTRADLTGADLTGAYLTRANLTGAYLTRADLTGAYLTGAYLTGADLTRAYLADANLAGARGSAVWRDAGRLGAERVGPLGDGMSALADSWLRDATGARAVEFYAELGIVLPDRGGMNVDVSCFSNPTAHKRDDRNASCSVSLTSGLWACHGCGQKGNAYQAALALGYTEGRARELAQQFGLFLEVAKAEPAERLPDERKLRKYREALVSDEILIGRLGELKGWTCRAIIRCGLGWNGERITFTIRDRKLKRVGVMLYHPNPPQGVKKITALPGTKRMLFPPPEVMSRRLPLFVCEGEACAVSVRSCGLQAVAVPGAGAWRPEWAQRLFPFSVVVLPDADRQGRDMALRVAAALPKATVVDLHPGCDDGADIGDWVSAAAQEGGLSQVRRVLERIA